MSYIILFESKINMGKSGNNVTVGLKMIKKKLIQSAGWLLIGRINNLVALVE